MRSVRKFFFVLVPLAGLLSVCKNVDSVKPTDRITFIKVYEKGNDYAAQVAEPLSDGYIVGSNLSFELGSDAYVTRTDIYGNIMWETRLKASSIVSIKVLSDGGYLVYGDGIHTNSKALSINDRVVTRAKITKLSSDGVVSDSAVYYIPGDTTTDFHGTGLNIDKQGNIVIAGTKKASATGTFYEAFVAVYKPSLKNDTLWTRPFPLLDQDVINAKNIYPIDGSSVLWATSVQKVNLTQTFSYITIPTVDSASVEKNYSFLGQFPGTSKLSTTEMQSGFGSYGVVGTFAESGGKNGNIFFVRAGSDGTFEENSMLILDGADADPVKTTVASGASAISSTQPSVTEDAGLAISPANDGGYLIGGTMTSTLSRGNGGLDVLLIKIDANNKVIWSKVYGGEGNETVNSIRTLADGSFIVAGGSSTNGLSAAFIMRIDPNGEITK